ncbi:MAG: hypothetical protein PW734_08970 [Verrucomicrobium sp.]|nr:hypothetical protein [Verrucomicrobium sp.]
MRGAWLSFCLGAALLSGCASISGNDAAFTGMTKDKASFSTTGPEQMVPDRYLPAGTRLRVIGHGGDSVLVQLVDGSTGFVPEDKVTLAPDQGPLQP